MKKLFTGIAVALLATLAYSQANVKIKGTITGGSFTEVVIDHVISGFEHAKAPINDKGEFKVEFKIDKSDYFRVRFTEDLYLIIVPEIGEQLEIAADANAIYKPTVKGSPGTQFIYKTFSELDKYSEKLEQLQKQIETEKQNYLRTTLSGNLNSLSALFFIDQLNPETDAELLKKLSASLSPKYSDNMLVMELNSKLDKTSFLSPGTPAPEIALLDTSKTEVKLSSLKGKYVLIDFWASWCGPCRKEAPNLVALYQKYKSKGFEIFGVSLDREEAAWKNAIIADKLAWIHVSDLKYWDSEVVEKYQIEGIPFTVLIDPQGNVLAVGLRGEELDKKLAEIFK
ncbi:MAG TPA: hypothetical protein DCQ31_10185 [Bacteroidales bacterium]|nr:hypothetical protein [Bacteroidales bacterium]